MVAAHSGRIVHGGDEACRGPAAASAKWQRIGVIFAHRPVSPAASGAGERGLPRPQRLHLKAAECRRAVRLHTIQIIAEGRVAVFVKGGHRVGVVAGVRSVLHSLCVVAARRGVAPPDAVRLHQQLVTAVAFEGGGAVLPHIFHCLVAVTVHL